MAVTRLILPLLIIVLAIQWVSAQSDLHRYDEAVRQYYNSSNADSFTHYINLKLKAARAADSLELWAGMQGYVVQYFGNNTPLTLQIFEQIDRDRWRQPANAAEWLPFFDLEATKAWHQANAGRIWESIRTYEYAESIFETYKFPDRDITEYVYKYLSNNYTRLGDNEKALVIHQKALNFSEKTNNLSSLPGIYNNIGITYWNNKQLTESEQFLLKGLALPNLTAAQKAQLMSALSSTYLTMGRTNEATDYAQKAIGLLKKPGNGNEYYNAANACLNRAAILVDENKSDLAFPLLRKARQYAEKRYETFTNRIFGKIANQYAEAWLKKQQPEKALLAANESLSTILPGFNPAGFMDNPAVELFYQEVTIAEALQIKAQAFEKLFHLKNDQKMLEKGLECLDLAWKVNRMVRENYVYQSSKLLLQDDWRQWDEMALRYCRILFEKNGESAWAERAFQIVERNKAAILLDALKENLALQRLATNDPRFEEMSHLRQNIAFLERELLLETDADKNKKLKVQADAIRTRIAALETAVRREHPALSGLFPDLENLSGNNAMQAGELLIEYFSGSTVLEIFVRSSDGRIIAWKQGAQGEDLNQSATLFASFFEDANAIAANPAQYFDAAFKLWQILIPAEAVSVSRIVIAPDGFVSLLPFEALLTAAATAQTNLKNAPYLIKNQTVRYVWSLSTLYWQQALSPSGKGVLGVAPGFENGNRGLSPLLTGGKEWANAGAASVLLKDRATRGAFSSRAVRFAVLHLATHAQAGAAPRIEFIDDAFYLADIYALRLQAELIVLSACETGTGIESKGEGVMSLSRAFACAGARSLIGSLWRANDQSAASILSAFYLQLKQRTFKSDALRNAKLQYLEADGSMALKSPWYWAGFSFSGADGPLEIREGFSAFWPWITLGVAIILPALYFLFFRKKK